MMEQIEAQERIFRIYSIGLNYKVEIEFGKRGETTMNPFQYHNKNAIDLLNGFDSNGFNPKDDEFRDKLIKILEVRKDFPIRDLESMGVELITYRCTNLPKHYNQNGSFYGEELIHLSFNEYDIKHSPLELIRSSITGTYYAKVA